MEKRRDFIKKSCLTAFGAMFLGYQSRGNTAMPNDDINAHTKWWLDTLLTVCDTDEYQNCSELVEACGRECAKKHMTGLLKFKTSLAGLPLETQIQLMNENHIGGDSVELKGDTIEGKYAKCYCPTRSSGMVTAPAFCNCTIGWLKEVYENLFDKKVEVRLIESIGRGGEVCRYQLKLVNRE